MQRYIKNINSISPEENNKLAKFKVCVIGCGGLGGYIIEMLGRIGVGYIAAIDGDCFEESNLNRQLLSDMQSLGKSKSLKAAERMKLVNPLVKVIPIYKMVDNENAVEILSGHDVIVDALDNKASKLILQNFSEKLNIPLIHGAIAGWNGQVTTIFPGDRTLDIIYSSTGKKGIESSLGNPPFSPALVASIQVSEVIKVLLSRGEILRKEILFVNLLENSFEKISI
jgi:molybdopterin-synthase adenylyltransferase